MTGREQRQPRTHARPLPPGHTHTRTRCRRLPPPPAGFLPLRGPGCSGGLLNARLPRASDPAPTRRPFPDSHSTSPIRSPATLAAAAAPSNSAPAARDSSPSARSSGARLPPRLRPRPARPAPEPAPTGGRVSAPLLWRRAGLQARLPAGRSSGPPDPSCSRARLPPPAAGMPWAAGLLATSAAERSGSAPGRPGCCPPPGLEGEGPEEVENKFRLRGCVSKRCVLKQTPASYEPLAQCPSEVAAVRRTAIPGLANVERPCNYGPRQHRLGSGRKNHATPRGARG